MTAEADYIPVASAEGPGAGRLLAAALLDALNAGARLLVVCEAGETVPPARHAVDFVFASDDPETDEVIRAGMSREADVVSTQLLRCPKVRQITTEADSTGLRTALRAGSSVERIRWRPKAGSRSLEVIVRADYAVTLSLSPS